MAEPSAHAQTGHRSGELNESEEKAGGNLDVSAAEAKTAALKARKRTKTGCLTCRKRRIKCGEERPTCKNCVKSKRECEGYIPRVIFKDPLGAFQRNQPGIAVRTPQGPGHHGATGMYGPVQVTPTETPIAPRLPTFTEHRGLGPSALGDYYSANGHGTNFEPYPGGSEAPPQQSIPYGVLPNDFYQHNSIAESFPNSQIKTESYPAFRRQITGERNSAIEMGYNDPPSQWSHGSEPPTARTAEFPPMFAGNPNMPFLFNNAHNTSQREAPKVEYFEQKPIVSSLPAPSYPAVAEGGVLGVANHHIDSQAQSYGAHTLWGNEPEDEYFDVDTDDEDYNLKPTVGGSLSCNLGPLIAMSANHSNGGRRSMQNFLNEPNVLATYHPSYAASPLLDPQTARIFCHFITATAPTLAVCERRPSNPAVIFSGVPVPKSQRSLWSYTLPMLALTHQGLLHAMLAMASLHISKLQNSSPTPSLKHYHYALRRVAKALGNPKRRNNVATLAATLLLGFYEVTTAEHNKWNSHLSGARELIMDIDFAGMAKKIETHRCRQEEAEANSWYQTHNGQTNGYYQFYPQTTSEDFPARADRQLNENLISTLIGWRLRYNQYGQVIDDNNPPSAPDVPLTTQEIENFEIQCDLFWWYAKQDMYQSILSGNRLLLSYDRWSLCPPRAPVGRLDAVYGTLDHLLLLMGRLADFAGKDLPRKLRAQREAEKRARSQSNTTGIPTAQPLPPQSSTTMPNGMQARPMYGMMPDPGPVRVPSGFDQAQHDRIYTAPVPSEDKSLDLATHEADNEWAAISQAFEVFLSSLGPAYAPLEPEHMTPMATPFGLATYYRSYAIACILTMYYCGRIICMRVKPNMPPAAMAAAGIAAQSTAHFANNIGRIVAGIQPIDSSLPINPHHGAALMDVCMSLFHAGVQYTHPGQRGWTITKLRDTARLTGWQTSTLIASGCERAWVRAAQMGRGPPYVAVMDHTAKDDRVAGRGRDPKDLEQPPKDNTDRRFITVNAITRVHWALGVLGIEEDMKGMKLD